MNSKNFPADFKCSGLTPMENAERHYGQQLAGHFAYAMNARRLRVG